MVSNKMNVKESVLRRSLVVLLVVAFICILSGCTGVSPPSEPNASNEQCPPGERFNTVTGRCEDPGTGGVPDSGRSETTPGENNRNGEETSNNTGGSNPWADNERDGVPGDYDNCPEISNTDQTDTDEDGIGDVCDNCPSVANRSQTDSNGDGRGDHCSEASDAYDPTRDDDGDNIPDSKDNCVGTKNPDQKDPDGDSIGSRCDNCPKTENYPQTDSNGDGVGDACSETPSGPICSQESSDFERLAPNIYLLLDKSGSMSGQALSLAKDGLDQMATRLADSARFGLSIFPKGGACNAKELLSIGQYGANAIKSSYSSVVADGDTPTGAALNQIRTENRLNDSNDPKNDKRPRALVLITDGRPTACTSTNPAEDAAAALKNNGVKVFVVGFQFDANVSKLNSIAQAGGTNNPNSSERFFDAQNSNQLSNALSNISAQIISCSYVLDPPPEDSDKIWVQVGGETIDEGANNGYTYESTSQTLTLHGNACDKLQSTSSGSGSPLEIKLGCKSSCEPEAEEICDYKDNDCDREIDEGCDNCRAEVCDGTDNDCDETIDEGCPDCKIRGKSCTADDECCFGSCREGTCKPPCRPLGATCTENSDCCGGSCGIPSDKSVGSCVSG